MTSTSPFMAWLRVCLRPVAAATAGHEACGLRASESSLGHSSISRAQGSHAPQQVATPVQDCSCSKERAPSTIACCSRDSEIPWQTQTYMGCTSLEKDLRRVRLVMQMIRI